MIAIYALFGCIMLVACIALPLALIERYGKLPALKRERVLLQYCYVTERALSYSDYGYFTSQITSGCRNTWLMAVNHAYAIEENDISFTNNVGDYSSLPKDEPIVLTIKPDREAVPAIDSLLTQLGWERYGTTVSLITVKEEPLLLEGYTEENKL